MTALGFIRRRKPTTLALPRRRVLAMGTPASTRPHGHAARVPQLSACARSAVKQIFHSNAVRPMFRQRPSSLGCFQFRGRVRGRLRWTEDDER